MPKPSAANEASHSPAGSTTVVDPYPPDGDGTLFTDDVQPHQPDATSTTRRNSVFSAVPATVMVASWPRARYCVRIFSLKAGLPDARAVLIGPNLQVVE